MRKDKTQKLLKKVNSLDSKNRLVFTKLLIKELYSDKLGEPEINIEDILNQSIMKVKREETKSIKKAVSNYSELDSKTKRQIITELIELINIKHEEYIEEKNKRICEAEGHIFGKWKYETYQTTSKVGIGGYIYPEIITQDIYTKKCERCGALKMVGYKPEDYDEQVALEKEEIERREKQLIKD